MGFLKGEVSFSIVKRRVKINLKRPTRSPGISATVDGSGMALNLVKRGRRDGSNRIKVHFMSEQSWRKGYL